jgi:hypothetical protein
MSWAQGNEEPHKAAVRASIVATKRGNDRGAKGRRKMDRYWNTNSVKRTCRQ